MVIDTATMLPMEMMMIIIGLLAAGNNAFMFVTCLFGVQKIRRGSTYFTYTVRRHTSLPQRVNQQVIRLATTNSQSNGSNDDSLQRPNFRHRTTLFIVIANLAAIDTFKGICAVYTGTAGALNMHTSRSITISKYPYIFFDFANICSLLAVLLMALHEYHCIQRPLMTVSNRCSWLNMNSLVRPCTLIVLCFCCWSLAFILTAVKNVKHITWLELKQETNWTTILGQIMADMTSNKTARREEAKRNWEEWHNTTSIKAQANWKEDFSFYFNCGLGIVWAILAMLVLGLYIHIYLIVKASNKYRKQIANNTRNIATNLSDSGNRQKILECSIPERKESRSLEPQTMRRNIPSLPNIFKIRREESSQNLPSETPIKSIKRSSNCRYFSRSSSITSYRLPNLIERAMTVVSSRRDRDTRDTLCRYKCALVILSVCSFNMLPLCIMLGLTYFYLNLSNLITSTDTIKYFYNLSILLRASFVSLAVLNPLILLRIRTYRTTVCELVRQICCVKSRAPRRARVRNLVSDENEQCLAADTELNNNPKRCHSTCTYR